jgi:hypothetical protein
METQALVGHGDGSQRVIAQLGPRAEGARHMALERFPWTRRRDRDLARTPKFGPLLLHAVGAAILAVAGAIGLYLFLAWLMTQLNTRP